MITYINDENKYDYTVLFSKASVKLGLLPFDKEIGVNPDGTSITEPWKYVEGADGVWTTVRCIPYDAENPNNPDTDFDAEGNFLITKVIQENGEDRTVKVVSKGISSLNEYFQYITRLAELAIGQGRTGTDPYFLRLPLDEPFFEINANTRAITVPAQMRQIGVIGDKLAEVLFFKIDRYFDAVDLNTRQIYIEWRDAAGNKGISRDYLRDVQSEKDKIIFGWAIGEELTHTVGTINFAVRFVEWTNREDSSNSVPNAGTGLEYSFSSLPASVTISDSLHYSLFENDTDFVFDSDDSTQLVQTLKFYLQDSEPDVTGETSPALSAIPVFLNNRNLNYIENVEITGDDVLEPNKLYRHNLIPSGTSAPDTLKLVVEASSPDGGSLSYMYGYKPYDYSGTAGLATNMEFLAVSNTDDNDRTYYKKDLSGAYVPVSSAEIEAETSTGVQYYERVATTVVDKPGYYYAVARNRVGGKRTNNGSSYTLYVPYAAAPIIPEDGKMSSHFVINERTYELAKNPNVHQETVEDQNKSNIQIVVTAPEGASASVLLQPTILPGDDAGTAHFSYTWYRNPDIYTANTDGIIADTTPYISRPDGLTDQQWADRKNAILADNGWVKIVGADGPTYTATQPGCYMLIINNHFNNDNGETNFLAAGICRVTEMPTFPVIDWEAFTNTLIAGRDTQPEIVIHEVDHDNMHYQWHKITRDNEDMDEPADGDLVQASGDLVFENGIAKIPFLPQTYGSYYFILSNTLNGVTAYMNSSISCGKIIVEEEQSNQ